tara:strand:- start:141 stop:584 length:444 start_codon:yes stop_codon:yes gene_type:complete
MAQLDNMKNTKLTTAFLNTNYTIHSDDVFKEKVILKIGEIVDFNSTLPDLEEWTFITAWNPLPDILSNELNRKRNTALITELKENGFKSHLGIGISEDAKWFEDSFFVENMSLEKSLFYAKKFGQVAFVHGKRNQKVELVFTKDSYE